MITNKSVELACTEVSEYSEEQMASEFERFFTSQPDLCEFVGELTTESDQKIQELSLFLSYMVYKVVQGAQTSELPAVPQARIEAAFHESEGWIERMNQQQQEDGEPILPGVENDPEPNLLQYVISEINEPMEDGTMLADEEKGEVFFVLKTVIASLIGGIS